MNLRYLISLAAILGLLFGAAGAQAQPIGFATLPPGAINNVQAQVIAKVVQANSDLKVRVTPYRGGGAIAAAVQNQAAEFGITDVIEMTDALTGAGRFDGRAMADLRVAFRILAFPISIFVRQDSDIQSLADLKGRPYATKWSAFPNALLMSNALLSTAGLSLDDVDPVPTANIIRAAEDFKAGKTDAFIFAVGAPKVAEVNSAVGGIRALSMPNTAAANAAIRAVRPDYFMFPMNPAPPFAGIVKTTWVLASDLIIYVGGHVPDETVYKFVKAVYGNKDALVAGHPSFRAHQPDKMAKPFTTARYHPGAIKFFKEVGIWPGE